MMPFTNEFNPGSPFKVTSTTAISDSVAAIRSRIAAAARRSGRNSDEITLMAVTKTQSIDNIAAAYEAGIRSFGENRVQEFAAKHEQLKHLEGAKFTLIGQLQSNKVGKAIDLFSAIHSVDSPRLAERINGVVERAGKPTIPIAIEINTGDPAKAGLDIESPELEQILHSAQRLPHVSIVGFMTIPPFTDNPEDARPYFRRLRELRDRVKKRNLPGISMELLSMGMSHDFEVAIEEGSTCVRVGTAIFGERS